MLSFTLVECLVGLFLLLGLFFRLTSLGVSCLALGILLGSGWLGSICVDEWQIGVLGLAGGFTLMLTGGGRFTIDNRLFVNSPKIRESEMVSLAGIRGTGTCGKQASARCGDRRCGYQG